MKRLDLAPGFAAALCLLRLLAEPRVFYAFLAAAAAHEAGHVMAIYLVGGRVTGIRLGMCDAKIETRGLGYRQEIFCALAGPGMSVLVCLALRKAYATCAAISLLLGLFNAMPVYPLDGGRALRAGLCLVLPLGRAEAVSNIAGLAVCAVGLAGAIFCARAYGLGFAPVALWLVVFARVLRHGHEEGLVSRAPVRYNK
ncbi:MAG: M50 family metallopeptidase [Firmicutes bacterium]|nr:M50 family metallopeptidase [Bacillota bacterium]